MNESVKTYTVEEAKRRLERYCAYQERSHRQVRDKLREMRMIPLAIDEVIVHLIKHDFLNEERFARSYARGKFRLKKWGRDRITRTLYAMGLSDYLIEAGLEEIDEEETGASYPALIYAHGSIPAEAPEKSFVADDFDEFEDEFNDFDLDEDDYGSFSEEESY